MRRKPTRDFAGFTGRSSRAHSRRDLTTTRRTDRAVSLATYIDRRRRVAPRIWIINRRAVRTQEAVRRAAKLCRRIRRALPGLICRVRTHQRLFIKAAHVADAATADARFYLCASWRPGARISAAEQRPGVNWERDFQSLIAWTLGCMREAPGDCRMAHVTVTHGCRRRGQTVACVSTQTILHSRTKTICRNRPHK